MDNNLRLIANPYLLNKKKDINQVSNKNDYNTQLSKIIQDKYMIYIHPALIQKIQSLIDNEINDYIIDKHVNDFIDDCIEKTIKNLI